MKNDEWLFYGLILLGCAVWTYDTVVGFEDPALTRPEIVSVESVVRFSQVQPILHERCLKCHSAPRWDWTQYSVAFEKKDRIKARVWSLRSMPLGTPMPEAERKLIRDWVDGGGLE